MRLLSQYLTQVLIDLIFQTLLPILFNLYDDSSLLIEYGNGFVTSIEN